MEDILLSAVRSKRDLENDSLYRPYTKDFYLELNVVQLYVDNIQD